MQDGLETVKVAEDQRQHYIPPSVEFFASVMNANSQKPT